MEEFDLLINNASVVDGSGKPPSKRSIAIRGDKVAAVGTTKGDAKKVIDATGLTAVPGFIDSHSHADGNLLFAPRCENYVLMGCTTFIAGQCAISPAPIGDMIPLPGHAHEYIDELTSYKYRPRKSLFPRDQVNEVMKEHFGWTVDWRTMGEFFKVVESRGISANYVPLVGHGAVRSLVMGEDYKRHSTKAEQAQMAEHIRKAMDDLCIGLSVGLDYDPDVWAAREEIVDGVSLVKEYGGIFVPHSRRTGRRLDLKPGHRMPDPIDGLREVIDICRATCVRMNIAHIFTGWYITPRGGPHILEEANRRATMTIIDEALKEGLDISYDALPSTLSTSFGGSAYLCALLLPWLREYGTRQKLAEKLKNEDIRDDIALAITSGKWSIDRSGSPLNPITNPGWAENITVLKHKNPACENKSLAKIAQERGKDPFNTWFDLIIEDPDSRGSEPRGWYAPGEPDAWYHAIFYEHPQSAVGLDTGVVDYDYESKSPPWSTPGVVQFSAFVGFLDKYVNKLKLMTLEQAVHKTSTQAALRHGLKGRGIIKEGSYADIVLLDLPNLKVMGTALQPKQPPKGIEHVFVNGVEVARKGQHTGARPGRVLRRG